MGSVEKLERILDSEEYARDRMQEARERAAELEREAATSAAHVRQVTLDAAREETRVATAALIDTARANAADYEEQAAIERALSIERASQRIESAVAAVLRELVD